MDDYLNSYRLAKNGLYENEKKPSCRSGSSLLKRPKQN